MPVTKQQERVSARVPHHIYVKLTEAAEAVGATLNQFLLQSAIEKANAVLDKERTIQLSRQDARLFFEAMDNPPPVNEKLADAIKEYQEAFPDAENRGTR